MDYVHHIAAPGESSKPSQKAWVNPSTVSLSPSTVAFTTDCGKDGGKGQWGNTWSYHYFRLSPKGLHEKPCGIVGPGRFQLPGQREYLNRLDTEGDKIQAAVGLSTSEQATKISGNHAAITAVFDTSTGGKVKTITIYRNKRAKIVEAA
jgi:hypothetical protein